MQLSVSYVDLMLNTICNVCMHICNITCLTKNEEKKGMMTIKKHFTLTSLKK